MTRQVINIKCTNEKLVPYRAHDTDAGADLRSVSEHEIYPQDMVLVDTGVSVAIPEGYMGLVVPRSSMGKVRVSIANTAGIIDSDYRGNIMVRLINEGEDIFTIVKEDTRIAQLIVVPVLLAAFSVVPTLDETKRGTGGFGSTGA